MRSAPVINNSQDLRGFSNQNPRHRRQQISHVIWSKGAAHCNEAIRISHLESFRKASRALQNMASLDCFNEMPKQIDKFTVKSSREIDEDEIAIVQDSVWKAFVDRDNYMDLAKKFNSSNIELLKDKQRHGKGLICPSDYDYQIRRCVANPGVYAATWNLLKLLIGEQDLQRYVGNCAYSERELTVCKLDPDLLKRLRIENGNQQEGLLQVFKPSEKVNVEVSLEASK